MRTDPHHKPAPASAGISSQDPHRWAGRATAINRLKASPTARVTGPAAIRARSADTPTPRSANAVGMITGDRRTDGDRQAGGQKRRPHRARLPGVEQDPDREQRAGQWDRIHRAQPGPRRAGQQDLPVAAVRVVSAIRHRNRLALLRIGAGPLRAPATRPIRPAAPAARRRCPGNRGMRARSRRRSASGGTSARRRNSHQPRPARAAPIIGPTTRRIGLLAATPASSAPKV